MRISRRTAARGVVGLALFLALVRAAIVPAWFADAQYYVQAGRLFREGTVTFAGHLVGDRHLAIGYYQIFIGLFGSTADAAAIALAVAFAVAACLVVTLCFIVGTDVWRTTLVAVALVVVLALIPIWNSMLTDPLLLVVLLLVLNGVAWLPRATSPIVVMAGIAAVCGVGSGVRPETVVMLMAVLLATLVTRWRGAKMWGRDVAVAAVAFVGGYALQSVAWYAWVPAPKPATYSAAFVFYLPMYYNAEPKDGPATAALARLEESAGLPLTTDYIGLFPVMAAGAKSNAVEETDRLIARAGLELLAAKPKRLLAMFAREGLLYVQRPALVFERSTDSWDRRWQFMRERLRDLDQRRQETSAGFGNDAFWQTETLGDQHLGAIVLLRSLLPSWSVLVRLPGVLLLIGLAATMASVLFRREHATPALAACLFVIGAFVITNFSQGFDQRYSEIWRYLSLVMVALAILTWPRPALTNT